MTSIFAIDPGPRLSVVVNVLGMPAPKGSNRAIAIGGRGRLVEGGSDEGKRRMKAWARAVYDAAFQATRGGRGKFIDAPLTVAIVFRMPRPGGHWRKGKHGEALKPSAPTLPSVKPDVDKLARSTLDALTGIVWDDDSRIVMLTVAKVYAAPGQEGASIAVRRREVGDADGLLVAMTEAFAAVEAAP